MLSPNQKAVFFENWKFLFFEDIQYSDVWKYWAVCRKIYYTLI